MGIESLFFTVKGPLDSFTVTPSGGWTDTGEPLFVLTAEETIPANTRVKTLMYPSGSFSDSTQELSFVSNILRDRNRDILSQYITQSGYLYNAFYPLEDSNFHAEYVLAYDGSNTYYNLGYLIEMYDESGIELFPAISGINDSKYLAPAPKPRADMIQFPVDADGRRRPMYAAATFVSGYLQQTRLVMRIPYIQELPNYTLSTPSPYGITISGVNTEDSFINASGEEISAPYKNYFDTATDGMYLNLPFDDNQIYNIALFNIDQEGIESPYLTFNTADIRTSSDEFNQGELGEFDTVSLERLGEVNIPEDIVVKKRASVAIDDVALLSETYLSQGVYISDFYTIDNPLYTFSLEVNEYLPTIPGVDIDPHVMIKYYVEFQNQDWIRISPRNRSDEYDENGLIVPKMLILDSLGMGDISSDIRELPFDFSVFSFRLRIELDMSFVQSEYFVSPEVRSYKLFVTDRNSFFRIA